MTATMPLEVVTRRMQVFALLVLLMQSSILQLSAAEMSLPADSAKLSHTMAQIQGAPGHPVRYSSMLDCCQKILKEEGASAFWRGTLSSFMKVLQALCCPCGAFKSYQQLSDDGG
jgi:Mitochondrial carrier protein